MRSLIVAATTFALVVSTALTVTPAPAKHQRHKSETAQYMRAAPSGSPLKDEIIATAHAAFAARVSGIVA